MLGMPTRSAGAFKGSRFPRGIINHAVRLSYRFSLSLRDAERIHAYRGTEVKRQTVHEWEQRFGPLFAGVIRRNKRTARPDKVNQRPTRATVPLMGLG